MTHIVMFDIDGTLVDSVGFDAEFYAQAVSSVLDMQIDATWQSYRNVTDSGILEELLERSHLERPMETLRAEVKQRFVALVQDHLARYPAAVREIAGARAFIEGLSATAGVRVAIATGGWAETARLKLQAIGLRPDAFPLATASDGIERTQIMQLAEQRAMTGIAPLRKTYFGDGSWDKRASAQLGYRFIAVGRAVEHDVAFDDFSDPRAVLACLAA